mmetsp:Transcript_24049/g.56748  ORF Transcript_24049/g.56748 Transcript_24049/m.56748 type:complete len:257 (+) Transcript_24049:224-994(+)
MPQSNSSDLFGFSQVRYRCLGNNFLGHLTRVMVRNLPLSIFKGVYERISCLNFVASGTQREFVNTVVHCPVVADGDIRFKDFTLRLLLAKINEIGLDGVVIGTRDIRNGWQQARRSLFGVSRRNLIRVESSQGVVPLAEQTLDFLFGDRSWCSRNLLRHLTGMVVSNLPLTVFVHVNEGVSSLDLVSGCTQGELVNTNILAPVCANSDEGFQNFSLWLLEQKGIKVVRNLCGVIPRNIGYGWQQDSILGVSGSYQR